jgi:subtilase family serine protease
MANRTWWQGRAATLSWLVALVAGLIVAAAYPATANSGGGSKTPAVAVAPHYKVAGKANPAVPPTFTCQVTTPAQCFGPAQIRAAYGIDQVNATGAGRTIVIVDAFQSPTIQHDLDLFDAVFELPNTTVQIIAPDGLTPFDQADPNQIGWAGEISLDVEWAHAIAPAAKIKLVLA